MKSKLSCSVAQDLLPQYAENLLSPESEAELKAHLAECPACRKAYKEMTDPEPELQETAVEVDYLKKIRKSRLRLLVCSLAAVAVVAAVLLFCLNYQQKQADARLAEQEQKSSELLAEQEQKSSELLAEQEQKNSDLLEQIAQNAVRYDEASHTMVVYGNDTGAETVFPPEISKAIYLDAQFDSFHLSAFLPHLRTREASLGTYLPQYLNRTEDSFSFIRTYLAENCSDQYPAQRAAKYVDLTIHPEEEYSWSETEDRIRLEVGSYYWHREEVYILSLLGSKNVQWKQLGYAWYLGSCIDPYSEALARSDFEAIEDSPYGELYARAGGTAELTTENYRKLIDAVSCVCLTRGMNWGTAYESLPLSKTALYNAPKISNDLGDEMSVCMAASFIAWLSDSYGFDRVSSFCFGQTTFEESFETDYGSAYDDWSAWILQCFGEQ